MNAVMRFFREETRDLVIAAALLFAAGFVLSLAASPAATARMGMREAFHFAWRHGLFMAVAVGAFISMAMLDARSVRRAGALLWIAALVGLVAVLIVADPTKGARRWLDFGPVSVQPSEFAKPALIIVVAWMLSERARSPSFPGLAVAIAAFVSTIALVAPQPDIGQSALMSAAMFVLLFAAGAPWIVFAGGLALAAVAGAAAFAVFPHVRERVAGLLTPDSADRFQVDRALDAFASGGVLGRGPGEGVVKTHLPDAHADFVFAVAAEEFGWLALGLLALYAWIAIAGLRRASLVEDPFRRLAATGLITLFVFQAVIHVGVNVALLPAKGMTLPLVSYGGSSMLAAAFTLGCALALLREESVIQENTG
jgi:cell division protein FtsW